MPEEIADVIPHGIGEQVAHGERDVGGDDGEHAEPDEESGQHHHVGSLEEREDGQRGVSVLEEESSDSRSTHKGNSNIRVLGCEKRTAACRVNAAGGGETPQPAMLGMMHSMNAVQAVHAAMQNAISMTTTPA